MNKVYLSGPITGLTPQEARYGWRRDFAERLPWKYKVLSPMRHVRMVDIATDKFMAKFERPKWMVAQDLFDIQECSVMVVNLLGAKQVSIGTIAEVGYAYALGKTIVTIMEEGNVHDHSFITELSDTIVRTLEDGVSVVTGLLSEGI